MVKAYWYIQYFKQIWQNSPTYGGWRASGGDTFRIELMSAAYVPNQDTHAVRNDLFGEVIGQGYQAGGQILTNKTISVSAGALTLGADPVIWTGCQFSTRWAVIYDDTNSSIAQKQVVRFIDFGQEFNLSGDTFKITFDGQGAIIDVTPPSDIDPPILEGSFADGPLISLVYNELLDTGSVPAPGDFTVLVNAAPVAVSTVAITSGTVNLTLATPIVAADAVTLSYAVPTSGKIQDLAFNPAVAISSLDIDNVTTPEPPDPPPVDVTPPVVAITFPAEAAVVSDTITVTATATDANGIVSVVLYVDGAAFSTDTSSPYSFDVDTTTLSNGAHTLQAKAKDPNGNEGSSVVVNITVSNVTPPPVDTTPPVVTITSPLTGAFLAGTFTVAANVTDNVGVVSATLFVDDVSQGVDASQPYSFSLNTTLLNDGVHILDVRASDLAGNLGVSADVLITVDNTIPVLSTASINGASLTLLYNEPLNVSSVPSTSAFVVTTDGNNRSLTSVSVTGSQVFITLAVPVLAANVVVISYTAGASPIEDRAGNNAANLVGRAVTNLTPGDTSPPTISSLTVNAASLVVQYSENLDPNSIPATSAFGILVNGVTRSVNSVTISGRNVTLTLSSAVVSTDNITASYTPPATGKIRDLGQNNAAAFFGLPVTNITTPAVPTDEASFVSQSVPSLSMLIGTTQNVTVTMRNDGTATWSSAGGYHLYSQNPSGNTRWGLSQVPVQGSILEDSNCVFTFTITAPTTPGTYAFQWRMRHTLTEFGSLTPNVNIAVNNPTPTIDTFYVAITGNDSTGTGTSAAPWRTIAKGFSMMTSGDTLIIRPGTYVESAVNLGLNSPFIIPSGVSDSQRTVVMAETDRSVTIRPSSGTGCLFVHSRNFITIRGIIFDGVNIGGNSLYVGRASTSNPATTNISIINCDGINANPTSGGGGLSIGFNQDGVDGQNFLIKDCRAFNCGHVSGGNQVHGIYASGQDVIIEGGEYFNNAGHGVHVFAHDVVNGNNDNIVRGVKAYNNGSHGIGLYNGSNLRCYNNLVYDNGGSLAGTGGIAIRFSGLAVVLNNTIFSNTANGIWITSTNGGSTIRNNIIYQNGGSTILDTPGLSTKTNNIEGVNPLFVNQSAFDFHLLQGSPAINAGFDVSSTLTTDFDNVTRTSPFDCGAYEFTGTTTIYGTYTNPFTATSIWNTPIAGTATTVAAGISAPINNVGHINDHYIVKRVFRADPLVNVHQKTNFGICGGGVQSQIWYQIPLPSGYVNNSFVQGNAIACFIEVDHLTVPGRISEGLMWERCSAGAAAAQFGPGPACLDQFNERNLYTITSSSIMQGNICVGASSFSQLGGVIRSGEWTSAAGVPIPHALRLVVGAKWLDYPGVSGGGFRWPAHSADSYASTGYVGSVPDMVIGSLCTMSPSATESSLGLTTEPGKKVFHAIQTYGAYVVDTFPNSSFNNYGICLECSTHGSSGLTVANEFLATYGVDIVGRYGSFHGWTGFELQFHTDLVNIFNNLRVVTNTSPSTPKG